MERNRPSSHLAVRLSDAENALRQQPKLEHAHNAVTGLMRAVPSESELFAQLKRLENFIQVTNAEITALKPTEVNSNFIPTATDELDAIVEATAAATNRIMDAAEVFNALAGELPAASADKAVAAVNSIYEACSFQDITGQRVTKVIKLLRTIEERISQMVGMSGAVIADVPATAPAEPENPDDALLNGPALPAQAKSQQEIDALFSA